MQRYFVKEKKNDKFILESTDIHHIKKVMRCKNNDKIEIVCDKKVYLCNIDNIETLELSIIESYEEDRKSNVELTVAVSLVQEQKFDLILQKLTELGVNKIIPVKTERSNVKIDASKEDTELGNTVEDLGNGVGNAVEDVGNAVGDMLDGDNDNNNGNNRN